MGDVRNSLGGDYLLILTTNTSAQMIDNYNAEKPMTSHIAVNL